MIRRLLIANRGEIACRILRTARTLGIETAVIHSDVDRRSLPVRMADHAFCVGPSPSTESYLDIDRIVRAARSWKADAIHPGYGFLSENAGFAEAVRDAGMIFVGPPPEAIRAMGSKSQARSLMQQAGVPVVPGFQSLSGPAPDDSELARQARDIGYPVLIKAVAGGGGRGLRVVRRAEEFDNALQSVRREAQAGFGSADVLLEKYLDGARHIEVQIFADQRGQVVHLFERDCSVQRRHQKLIEEAPAPGLSASLRDSIGQTAVQAARAIGYCGAGTVEFLLQDDQYWFMEMNTRLQVEHPVTEAITGVDLVEWQLQVADGQPLPESANRLRPDGNAIEVRLNAELPEQDFLPSAGRIQRLHWPGQPGLRIDAGYEPGDTVSVHYDSLLAKLIVHAPQRATALQQLGRALLQTRLDGVGTNALLLAAILRHPEFQGGAVATDWLERQLPQLLEQTGWLDPLPPRHDPLRAPDDALRAWRNIVHNEGSRHYHLMQRPAPGHGDSELDQPESGEQEVLAPLPGRVVTVRVSEGDRVETGQPLLVLEAMKMEHTLTAPCPGRIAAVHHGEGDLVAPEAVLVTLDAGEADD